MSTSGAQRVDRLLKDEEAAAMLGVETKTMAMWRFRGIGPRFIKIGQGRAVRYSLVDMESYIEQLKQVAA